MPRKGAWVGVGMAVVLVALVEMVAVGRERRAVVVDWIVRRAFQR